MAQNRPLFWYNLRTQYENLGDLVINRECIRLLRMHGDVIVNASGVPAFFLEGLQLAEEEVCIDNKRFHWGLLKSRRKSFLVLVPGAMPSKLQWTELPRQLLVALHFKLLALRGVRIIKAGVSIDNLSPLRRFVERLKSQSMAFLGPRDAASLVRARSFGLRNVGPFQDFAFLLPVEKKIPRENEPIVVSFRANDNVEVCEILSVIDPIVMQIDPDHLREIVFVSQVEHDRHWAESFIAHFRERRVVVHIDHSEGVDQVFAVYDRAVCVLSNRLHVLLFALSRGAPIWAVVDPDRNAKIVGLFADVGLGDRLLSLSEEGALRHSRAKLLESVDPSIFARKSADLREKFSQAIKF